MESPYRPPRELESSEEFAISLDESDFHFDPSQQQMIGRLAKYLRDIGGLLMFLAVISLIGALFTGFVTLAGQAPWMLAIQFVNQLFTVVFLFLIGSYMRKASVPLRAISESSQQHIGQLMSSMRSLYSLYGIKILYLAIGLVISLLTTVR